MENHQLMLVWKTHNDYDNKIIYTHEYYSLFNSSLFSQNLLQILKEIPIIQIPIISQIFA